MQPCFTPVWHRKAGVSIFSIFTDDLSLRYHWSTLNVKSQGSAPLLPLASIFEMSCAPRQAVLTLVAIAKVAALCRKVALQGFNIGSYNDG